MAVKHQVGKYVWFCNFFFRLIIISVMIRLVRRCCWLDTLDQGSQRSWHAVLVTLWGTLSPDLETSGRFSFTLLVRRLAPPIWRFSYSDLQEKSALLRWLLIDLMQIWWLLISINWISSTKEMNPITRKSMSKLVMQPSFRAVGQTHVKW